MELREIDLFIELLKKRGEAASASEMLLPTIALFEIVRELKLIRYQLESKE